MKSELDRADKLNEFMTIEEEYAYYNEVLERVINNPRWYLNHLEELSVFKVSFIQYSYKKKKGGKAL